MEAEVVPRPKKAGEAAMAIAADTSRMSDRIIFEICTRDLARSVDSLVANRLYSIRLPSVEVVMEHTSFRCKAIRRRSELQLEELPAYP